MDNNEIMIAEEYEVMDDPIVADEGNGIGTGVAMLIGAGLAFAVGGAVKAGKWAYGKIKAKAEAKKAAKEDVTEESDQAQVEAE
jgi:hypothetical protein